MRFVRLVGRPTGAVCSAAHQQIPVGLPIFRRHHHIDDRIDARRQIDEQIAHDIQVGDLLNGTDDFRSGDWQIAGNEGAQNDEYHFEETSILGRHAAGIENRCARRMDGGMLATVDASQCVFHGVRVVVRSRG